MPEDAHAVQLRRFTPSYEALGIVLDFLVRRPPYDGFGAGKLVAALKHQIAHGYHICAFRDEMLIGYSGWLPITEDLGRLWLDGKAELEPVPPERSNAAALTIVCADDPAIVRSLIRATRKYRPGERVFFRRDYSGRAQSTRRHSVRNVADKTSGGD